MHTNLAANNLLNVQGEIIANTFTTFADDAAVPAGDVLFTVAQLEQLTAAQGKKGVLITVNDSPETVSLPLDQLDLIAVEFGSFADGRGYSFAALLRRQGFKGELRAVGDVFKDVLFFLKRCGFDSFLIKDGKDVAEAQAGLRDFTAGYQITTASINANYQAGG